MGSIGGPFGANLARTDTFFTLRILRTQGKLAVYSVDTPCDSSGRGHVALRKLASPSAWYFLVRLKKVAEVQSTKNGGSHPRTRGRGERAEGLISSNYNYSFIIRDPP